MMKKNLFSLIILSILFSSCSIINDFRKHETEGHKNEKRFKVEAYETTRLSIDFISRGTGINRDAFTELELFLKISYTDIVYTKQVWGREGEIRLCFPLTETSTRKQMKFVDKIAAHINGADRVIIKENIPCDGK